MGNLLFRLQPGLGRGLTPRGRRSNAREGGGGGGEEGLNRVIPVVVPFSLHKFMEPHIIFSFEC